MTPNGLDIINGMRKRLTQKIASCLEDAEDIDSAYNLLTGYMAVANALDIITDDEYQNAANDLYHFLVGLRDESVTFPPVKTHLFADKTMIAETLLTLKIGVQERLNDNLAKYRDPYVAVHEYSRRDVLQANDLILAVAFEFDIITKQDYDKAFAVMQEYVKDKPKTEKIIFVPEAFYTKVPPVRK